IALARLTQRQINDMQAGLRGHAITHDPRLLQHYTQAHTAFAADEKKLERLTADDPVQQQRLAQLLADHTRWDAILQQTKTLTARDYLALNGPNIEALRQDFDTFIATEENRRDLLMQATERLERRSLVVTLALALLLSLFLAFMNRRQLLSLSGSYERS